MSKPIAKTDRDYLRQVAFDGYALRTWDTGRLDSMGKCVLGYEMCAPDGSVLFTGEDYCCAPSHAIDSDKALSGLLGFLTLKPGDTDSEYFENYTPEQMVFAESLDCEALSLWTDDSDDAPAFTNLDDWT